jgi:hypothetical protein
LAVHALPSIPMPNQVVALSTSHRRPSC